MASADLDYIRALLIAQTAAPEPEPRRLFSRLIGKRRTPPAPLNRSPRPQPRFDPNLFAKADPDAALLLDQLRATPAETPLVAEVLSPLPPPAPRAAFGRRPDVEPEVELLLDQPATAARRLRLLDPSGQPIGEMMLEPHQTVARIVAAHHTPLADDSHAAPFFPEDLMDPDSPWVLGKGSEPMRPWIKALRNSTRPIEEPKPVTAPPPRKKVRRRKAKAIKGAIPPPPASPPSLGEDLLSALAVTLTHEHDRLADRLAELDLFQPAPMMQAAE
jgi:hypothetical protein